MSTKILWDGRNRTVTSTMSFEGTFTGNVMASKGWEPRWYMVGKQTFVKSAVDGAFFPGTHRPDVAPGFKA